MKQFPFGSEVFHVKHCFCLSGKIANFTRIFLFHVKHWAFLSLLLQANVL